VAVRVNICFSDGFWSLAVPGSRAQPFFLLCSRLRTPPHCSPVFIIKGSPEKGERSTIPLLVPGLAPPSIHRPLLSMVLPRVLSFSHDDDYETSNQEVASLAKLRGAFSVSILGNASTPCTVNAPPDLEFPRVFTRSS